MESQVNDSDPTILAPFAGRVRIPEPRDKIFKDECVFCFDAPVCIKLLFISIQNPSILTVKKQHFYNISYA